MDIYVSSAETMSVTTTSDKIPFTFGAVDQVAAYNIHGFANVSSAIMDIPDWSNTVSATLQILDANDYQVYASTAQTQDQIVKIDDIDTYFDGNGQLRVILTGAPGGSGGTAYVVLILKAEEAV